MLERVIIIRNKRNLNYYKFEYKVKNDMVHIIIIIIIIWFGQSGFLCSALNYIIIQFPDMIIRLF